MSAPDAGGVQLIPLPGIGEVRPGDDLARLILAALGAADQELQWGDIVVVTQKVVSKAEGCLVALRGVQPSELALSWGKRWDKDARVVELVLRESRRIVRMERGVIIAETRHGFICANAGVDVSNVGEDVAALLPAAPDVSADTIRRSMVASTGVAVGVVITDTFGRPWREGQTNVAIGVAGVRALEHFQGRHDPSGYELRVTEPAVADEIAGAADLVMGKLDRVPVALVRGLGHLLGEGSALELVRAPETDLFR